MLNTTSQNRLGMYCQSFIKHSRGNANNCLSFVKLYFSLSSTKQYFKSTLFFR